MKPTAGCFLVAAPVLRDPNFIQSVIYLLEHSESGSMGLIVNRPLDIPLSSIWEDVPSGLAEARTAADGGPVERDRGLLLHGIIDLPGGQRIGHGVVIGGEVSALGSSFADGANLRGPRLFLGHSGWSAGQLAQEVAHGGWIVRQGNIDHVLVPPPADLWRRLIDGGGAGLPEPSLN
ncbi:MAG: YqgE/AlgH family protein [Planctomycetota bacterium]